MYLTINFKRMSQRIFRNLMRSPFTMIGMATAFCCYLIILGTSNSNTPFYQQIGEAAIWITGLYFVIWSAWAVYTGLAKKKIKVLNSKTYDILNKIEFVLFLCWILSHFIQNFLNTWIIPVTCAIWVVCLTIAIRNK